MIKLKTTLLFCILFLCFLLTIFFWPPSFQATPNPASTYEEALGKFAVITQKESILPLSPAGHSRLFVHGKKTERVFVLLHGLSSCPKQFVCLGKLLFNSGANVVILRAKEAGFANLLNEEQGTQTGQDLLDQASSSLDIAAGLGDKISIIGISAGAIAAAWMAEHREGIDQVLLIAPFFAIDGWSSLKTDFIAHLLAPLPPFYFLKEDPSPPYVYPRFGTKSIAITLLLANDVRSFQGIFKTKLLSILLLPADKVVNNKITEKIAATWLKENSNKIKLYTFSKDQNIPHDCIDSNRLNQKAGLVYPKILEILQINKP